MKKFAFIAASTLLLASCSEENAPVNPAENQAITLSISEPVVLSRTVTSETGNVLKTTFVAGDQIGVSATGGASATNAKFTVSADGTSLTTETPINFQFNTDAALTAYTPYVEGTSANVTFSIKPNQAEADDFNASNFMTSEAVTVSKAQPNASLKFNPRMTLVYVEMAGKLGVNATNLKLRGIKPSLTWTASNDAVAAEGDATDVTMHKAADKSVFMAFIPAQTTTAGEQLFAITIGSDSYSYKPTGAIEFKEGTVKRFKLTVNADQTVNIESSVAGVTDWTDTSATENENGELTRNYLELISVANGTFTGKTLNQITGMSSAKEGWNALIAGTDNSSTITIENDESVITTKGGSWYQRGLYFRSPNGIGTQHKYQLKFEVKGGTDIQVAVMRGQETGTFTSNAYFAVAGNTAAKVEKTEADYTTKTLEVDLSKISTGNVDFSTGIGVIFYAKDNTEQTHYIKNVSLIEVE